MLEMDESAIQAHSFPESFHRGKDYYQQGAVLSLVRRGGTLQAEVAGSEPAPYDVRVSFSETGIADAACGCPYEWGGWCKHIVAALLVYVREPDAIQDLPALGDTLSGLDRDTLRDLLLKLAERDPSLAVVIEGELSLSASSGAHPIDAGAIRRRLRSSTRGAGYRDYGLYASPGVQPDEARRTLDAAWGFIRSGQSRDALTLLGAIADEYLESPTELDMEWEMLGDYGGELLDLLDEVGEALTEALLNVDDLSPGEREDWSAGLDLWFGQIGEYDGGETFGAALRAVEQGWSHPPLVRVLEGGLPDDEFFEELLDDPLTIARLDVLQRRGRHEEYLRLSEAADETTAHAVMLARLGRAEETVRYGIRRLGGPEEALTVAETLRDRGDEEAALRLGEHGLSLGGRNARLAGWVRDLAEETGRPELALEAAVAAFRADPDLTSYRRARELAGESWPEYQGELLDLLRQSASYYPSGPVDVFLHEDLIGDAISAVETHPVGPLVARVAEAAAESHPTWVIEMCVRRAEEIMDAGRSNHYDEAVTWLQRAREAYLSSGREEEWTDYLTDLTESHRRKYKLRPMLESLA